MALKTRMQKIFEKHVKTKVDPLKPRRRSALGRFPKGLKTDRCTGEI
jgi:hypothetical protein